MIVCCMRTGRSHLCHATYIMCVLFILHARMRTFTQTLLSGAPADQGSPLNTVQAYILGFSLR